MESGQLTRRGRRRVTEPRRRRARGALAATLSLIAVSSCAGNQPKALRNAGGDPSTAPAITASPTASYAVEPPGRFTGPLRSADVLITSRDTLPKELVEGIRAVRGVAAVEQFSLGVLPVQGYSLSIAAADPATFRDFTPVQTAQTDAVWSRVAGGEVAVDSAFSRRVVEDDELALGQAGGVHVGAYAPLIEKVSAVVNGKRGEQLGLPRGNALLVSTGSFTPSALAKQLEAVIADRASMEILALEFDLDARQTAVLTGTPVASVVGTFSYVAHRNGTITPDPAWVSAYIRTETVPILGAVTCNRAMFPQLRAALTEVVQRGLADKIHPDEYAGCYYPRFIGRNPANGLSLHSWGIAVDLNVPGNQRGTVGEIDREVVAIFKRWGFAWGGDWSWTDPMHFELNRVVQVR